MISTDRKHLLFIEPRGPASATPVVDELTRVVAGILRGHTARGTQYMGWHTCVCGMRSDTADLVIGRGGLTHSLAAHYLAFHRGEIPAGEMEKVGALVRVWTERHPALAATVPTPEEIGTVEHRDLRFCGGAMEPVPGILESALNRWARWRGGA